MREPPNKLLRIAVPLVFLIAGVGILFAVLKNTTNPPGTSTPPTPVSTNTTPSPAAAPTPATDTKPPAPTGPESADATPPAPTTTPNPTPLTAKLSVRKHPIDPAFASDALGSSTPRAEGGTHEFELRFHPFGAGLQSLTFANEFEHALGTERHIVQSFEHLLGNANPHFGLAPFSALVVEIEGVSVPVGVPVGDPASTFWKRTALGEFEATIVDELDKPLVVISRRFSVKPGSFEFAVDQSIKNVSSRPLKVVYHQIGPVDQPQGIIRYGGDARHFRFGFMDDVNDDPSRTVQSPANSVSLLTHAEALGKPDAAGAYAEQTLWPTPAVEKENYLLCWVGTTSRYYTVAAYNPPSANNPPADADKVFKIIEGGPRAPRPAGAAAPPAPATGRVARVAIPIPTPPTAPAGTPSAAIGLRLVSAPVTIAPDSSADFSITAYAGPTSKKIMGAQLGAPRISLQDSLIYTFGGPCGFCTFQSITHLLRATLGFLHDHIVFDWAIAVMVLVVVMRTLLHPVTRWSQVNMLRFSKRIAKLAPKQKALQEKYGDDPTRLRQEQTRLMMEEGVGIGAGVRGCLPAFLQMPVWMALAPMLYFTYELRHQGAFFGLFQVLSGGKWSFLADLAEPDRFIPFGSSFRIPLLSGLMGPIDGFNIMPILMGIVFFLQQKYLMPPPTTTMTPEQEQQLKIQKVMMVVLFPLMMYNAPSGLSLYFFTNSTLAIIESRHIRKKAEKMIEREEAAALVNPRKKPEAKQPGFLARMAELAEQRQQLRDQAAKAQARQDKKKKK